jgi:glycosyltransferase involved in cell wall biosynthesis
MGLETMSEPNTNAADHGSAPEVWVVLAAYNEQQRIGAVLDDLLGTVCHVVVVDDGSRDGTVVEALKRRVWVLRHGVNLGQGAALQTGISFALAHGAQYVATFDADGQHCASDLPAMVAAMRAAGADFALGSRFLGEAKGMPWLRRLTLQLAVLFTRVLYGILLSDAHNGIRVMTRRGAEQIHITLNRMEHATEIVAQIVGSRLRYVEVPVTIHYTADTLAKGQRTSAAMRLGVKLVVERLLR